MCVSYHVRKKLATSPDWSVIRFHGTTQTERSQSGHSEMPALCLTFSFCPCLFVFLFPFPFFLCVFFFSLCVTLSIFGTVCVLVFVCESLFNLYAHNRNDCDSVPHTEPPRLILGVPPPAESPERCGGRLQSGEQKIGLFLLKFPFTACVLHNKLKLSSFIWTKC